MKAAWRYSQIRANPEITMNGPLPLEPKDPRARRRAEVLAGFDAIERGDFEEYDERTTKNLTLEIKQRGRKLLEEKNAMSTEDGHGTVTQPQWTSKKSEKRRS